MEEPRKDAPVEETTPKFRGLYRHVKIPVKALDWTIVACVAVILLVFILELGNLGFTVTFNSKGGTDVPPQDQMYGQKLDLPEPPSREGYEFIGWYRDDACFDPWDVGTDTIETDMTLYAGWQKTS